MSATERVVSISKKRTPKALAGNRKPSVEAKYRLGLCAEQMLRENYSYREAQELLRGTLMQKAVDEAKGNKSKAAARLGIDRNHVHSYLKRAKGLI